MLKYPDQPMSPKKVYELVMHMGAQKTSSNANVDAKVRQVLKTHPEDFERVGRGKYALAN
jgi:Asp-tRNA(Asn)/Glu-tRNA(Gln) amidotransferase B subunit